MKLFFNLFSSQDSLAKSLTVSKLIKLSVIMPDMLSSLSLNTFLLFTLFLTKNFVTIRVTISEDITIKTI